MIKITNSFHKQDMSGKVWKRWASLTANTWNNTFHSHKSHECILMGASFVRPFRPFLPRSLPVLLALVLEDIPLALAANLHFFFFSMVFIFVLFDTLHITDVSFSFSRSEYVNPVKHKNWDNFF